MKAWICNQWGSPRELRLGDLPPPACPSGGVLIEPAAWGVNFADLVLIADDYQAKPALPFAPGMEVAGRIVETAGDCRGLTVGDRVAAYVEYGGYAERVAVPAANVAALPADTPMETAAAFPLAYATAMLALEQAAVAADEWVVIAGAAGAVGLAGIELAKRREAKVIACAGSTAKLDVARRHGADHGLLNSSEDLRHDILALTGDGADVVLDPVGGGFFETAFRALAHGGRMVTLGFASGQVPAVRVNHILVKHLSVIGSSFGLTCHLYPDRIAGFWPALVELLASGEIRPRVARTMPFDDLLEALERVRDRQTMGKIVLRR